MSKMKWLITLVAGLGLGHAINFLSELTFSFVDPQGDVARRLLLIFLFGLFYLGMYAANAWAERRPDNNPADPHLLGWTEAVEIVSLGTIGVLTLCDHVARQNGPVALAEWTTFVGLCLASVFQNWPSERQEQYREMEQWLLVQLRRFDRVSRDDVLSKYARTGSEVDVRESLEGTPKGRIYAAFLKWFLLNHRNEYMMGEGWIVPRRGWNSAQGYGHEHPV